MSGGRLLVRVAVPTPLRRCFDYLLGAADTARFADAPATLPGRRVRVPFGRSRSAVGVIVDTPAESDAPPDRLRQVQAVVDSEPLLPAELLALLQWAADYYHHPPGEVLAAALPGPLRRGETPGAARREAWRLTAAGRAADGAALRRRAPRQADVLAVFAAGETLGGEAIEAAAGPGWRPTLRRLLEKGLVEAVACDPLARPGDDAGAVAHTSAAAPAAAQAGPALNPQQSAAAARIVAALGGYRGFLLHGVTGSGKTEVYLHAIREVLARGRQALVLVPEIGLTPQLVARLESRLATPVAVLHSQLAAGNRADAWLRARDGRAGVVLGTRSGVFAPLAAPGLIVVDEEHDASLKQQDGFRYNARDLAVLRARRLGVPVVLGSATPAFESLYNVGRERYEVLRLTQRAGSGVPPTVRLVDLRRDPAEGGLTRALRERMRSHLAEGAQVLLFLNRRGFAPVWMCVACGWSAQCSRCDARLTYHQRAGRLTCHHCGHERPVPAQCPDCGDRPRPIGAGTEQIEQAIAGHFPDVELVRVDRDSTRRRGELEARLASITRGESRILIGTQMLTKGHDFPGVSLVGVLNADGGLFSTDFRAAERLAQLIVQVAGRAGRARSGGEVLVQTSFPDHPLLTTLLREGYEGFAKAGLAERERAGWPPFHALALLRAEAPQAATAHAFLDAARERAERLIGDAGVLLLGPAPAAMERRAGRYRAQLMLQAAGRGALHGVLGPLLPALEALPEARRVRWSLDVDPLELD